MTTGISTSTGHDRGTADRPHAATDNSISVEMLDDLFDLSPRSEPVGTLLPGVGRSDDCTSDGCTASCINC